LEKILVLNESIRNDELNPVMAQKKALISDSIALS
jgi:hypothetical protein